MKTRKQKPARKKLPRRQSALPAASQPDSKGAAQLVSFVDSLPGYAWMKDLEGRYVYGNAALGRLPAYRGGYLGKTDADILPAEIAAAYKVNDLKVITERKPLEVIEPYRVDGKDHVMLVSKFPIIDKSGAVIMVGGSSVDITDRKRAEAILLEAEQHYRDIFENAGEGIFQTTPDGRFITANPALARMHGFDSAEELIRGCVNISQDAYVDPARREELKRLLETQDAVQGFEFELARRDGSRISVSVNARAVRDEQGVVRYYEGTARDITDRKAAEQALRESEERYRDLVEHSHEFICTHDLQGVVLSANNAAARALGYNGNVLAGNVNIRDLLAPRVRHEFEAYMAQLKKDGTTSGFMVVQTVTGEERIWEYYNSLRTDGLAKPVVRGVARDITEQWRAAKALRESEERYRELFENSRDAIYVHDLRGIYTSVNRAAEKLSGFTRDEIIGKHYSNFVSPRHLRQSRENFCRKLDVPSETTYETAVVCKNGELIPVEVSSRLIHKDGEVLGVQGTVRDIRERKRTQEALQTYARRVIEVQEAERQNVARELHDEIGQILTAVLLNLHSVERTCVTEACRPRIKESLDVVEDALRRVRELSLELRPSLLDDLGLVSALRWYAERYTARSGIITDITGDADIGRVSHEIETACFRIIQEALTNTARHSRATRVALHIKRRDLNLYLTVRDDGIGFDSTQLLKGKPSAALGLHGMRERASAINGVVNIASVPGKGTHVRVSVPLTT